MAYTAAVITMSDKGSRGERVDTSGPALVQILKERGYDVIYTNIIPDEGDQIQAELIKCADELKAALILTTGGTGFSPRDVTPEATLAVIERETRGIPEAMRAESLKITNRGCLSRCAAGIRGGSLIINLPGSEKAAKENFYAVVDAVAHGMDMLASSGSADCAPDAAATAYHTDDHDHHHHDHHDHDHHDHDHHDHDHACEVLKDTNGTLSCGPHVPSIDQWLKDAKADPTAPKIGMYLTHNGVVRQDAKAMVRNGEKDTLPVTGMNFDYDESKVKAAIKDALSLPGIFYVRVWLNKGSLVTGDDIMYVLIGGDIRPHVVDALNSLVGTIKSECVVEQEVY